MAATISLLTDRWVAVYVRISKDKQGRAENVETQEKHGRRYAKSDWPGVPVAVYCDNDLTAADPDTFRPDYDRMLTDIRLGRVVHVVSADQDRLTRQPSEWEDLVVVLGSAGITETHGYRDGITPVKGSKLVGRVKAAVSAEYVEGIKVKVNEKLDELAAQGRPAGSVVFGYRHATDAEGRKTLEVDESQAPAIRFAAESVLAGWSLSNIANHLRESGYVGAHGGKIAATTVRQMLTNPTVAGLRVHRGEIIGRGNWTPILDGATWRAVGAKLGGARTVNRSDGGTYVIRKFEPRKARRYLLTGGIAVCGVCGHPLIGSNKWRRPGPDGTRDPWPYYFCHPKVGGKACVGTEAEPLERHVRDELLARIDADPGFLEQLAVDDHAAEREQILRELAGLDERRAELSRLWALGERSSEEWAAAREVLDEQQARLNIRLGELPAPAEHAVDLTALPTAWPNMTLDERRQALLFVRTRVTMHPAGTHGKALHKRVTVEFLVDHPQPAEPATAPA
ncbi:MAG: recombinase family protein [Acidimicrobiales bacterium]